jgi:hypothetical protein
VLIIAAQLSSAFWWQAICYSLSAIVMALLFSSFGCALASITLKRRAGWWETVGFVGGILGGVGLIAVGVLGRWALFRAMVLN